MTMDPATAAAVARTRSEVCDLHAALVENNLVAWTSGNVSARVPGTGPGGGLLVIKPSGVPYLSPLQLCLRSARRPGREQSGRVDVRQRVRAGPRYRPGRGPAGDQAERRRLRRPDPGVDGR